MTSFHGIVPPVLTPMSPAGTVDLDSLNRLVDHLIDNDVDGLFVLGSSGQVAYLTDDERETVIGSVVDRNAGKVPVVVGALDLTARRVIDQGRRAESAGADAIVVTVPMYALNDSAEIDRHFRMIAQAISIPVLAYDIPIRVHRKLDTELLMSLAGDGVIAGVKDSSGDDDGFRELLAANTEAGHPLALLTGHEVKCDEMFLAGADGAVPGLANVDPAGYVRLWQAAQRGDWEAVRSEQQRLARLFEIVFVPQNRSADTSGIGAFKAALACLGVLEFGSMPAPLSDLDENEISQISAILRDVGLGE
ncbi:MAG: dihydrodipicolinate synthase family protein [Ilumatobacteraceae bacterium]